MACVPDSTIEHCSRINSLPHSFQIQLLTADSTIEGHLVLQNFETMKALMDFNALCVVQCYKKQ